MIDLTLDSTVTRIVVSPIESDEDEDDEDDITYTRLITFETADGEIRLELIADNREDLEIETEGD